MSNILFKDKYDSAKYIEHCGDYIKAVDDDTILKSINRYRNFIKKRRI